MVSGADNCGYVCMTGKHKNTCVHEDGPLVLSFTCDKHTLEQILTGKLASFLIFLFSPPRFFSHDTNASKTRLNCMEEVIACVVSPRAQVTRRTPEFFSAAAQRTSRLCVRACATTVRKIMAAVNGRLGRTECGPRSGSNPKRVSKAPPHSHRPSPTTACVMSP